MRGVTRKRLEMGDVRDRCPPECERIAASKLTHHPKNWRPHGKKQRATMRDLFIELGFVKPVDVYVAREGDKLVEIGVLTVGDIVLMDGHLRIEELPLDYPVPINRTDLDESEAAKYLVTCDPLSAMAGQDDERLHGLLDMVQSSSKNVQEMLGKLVKLPDDGADSDAPVQEFQILIDCKDEPDQRALIEEFIGRGLKFRSMIS